MTTKQQYQHVLDYFAKAMPDAETALHFNNAFELLVAVVLSAQCTDERINKITPALFEALPTPEAMAAASPEVILEYIKSVSYPNSKAQHLHALANMLIDKFHGDVPGDMESLTSLPGVGRKTANVMLAIVFGKPAIAVDTHVFRVSNRTGLATGKKPLEVELKLKKNIPAELQGKAHHWILLHGRHVCKSRKPDCLNCGIRSYCNFYTQQNKE